MWCKRVKTELRDSMFLEALLACIKFLSFRGKGRRETLETRFALGLQFLRAIVKQGEISTREIGRGRVTAGKHPCVVRQFHNCSLRNCRQPQFITS